MTFHGSEGCLGSAGRSGPGTARAPLLPHSFGQVTKTLSFRGEARDTPTPGGRSGVWSQGGVELLAQSLKAI